MSLSFNGTSSVLTLSSGSLAGLSAVPLTIAAWVKPNTQNQGGVVGLHSAGAASWFGLQADDQWGNGMCGYAADGAATWKAAAALDSAAWQLLVFKFVDANSRRAYYKSTTGTGYTDNYNLTFSLDNLQIGKRTGSAGFYSGLIAHVGIWTVALSDTDVTALAGGAAFDTVQSANLFEYWTLLTQASTQTGSKAGIVLSASNTTENASNPPVTSDSTPPNLSAASASSITATTATLNITTDEANGTLYVVVTTSATQPSVAQIKAGQDQAGSAAVYAANQTVTSTGAKTFSATGMTASTSYYAHFVHADAAGNNSTRASTSQFTTLPAAPTAPTIGTTTGVSASGATINWTDNSSTETSFTVQVESPSGAGNWANASTGGSNPTAADVTSLAINSLSASTEYRPRVKASNAGGDSAWSTGTAFTTSAASGGGTPSARASRPGGVSGRNTFGVSR